MTNSGPIDATSMTPGVKTDLASVAGTNTPRLGVTAEQLNSVSPETRATFLAQASKYFQGEQVNTLLTNEKIPDAPTITKEQSAGIAGVLFPQAGISDAKAADAVENLKRFWTGSQSDLNEALNRAGIIQKQVEIPPLIPPGTLDPQLDAPASQAEYKISFANVPGAADADPTVLATLDRDMRQTLHASGVSMADANEVVTEGLKIIAQLKDATPAQVTQVNNDTLASVANIVGRDKLDDTLTLARNAMWRVPEALRTRLIQQGFARSPRVILSLAAAEQRRLMRGGK